MLLATEPAVLFLQFVQILCWIVLPVLLSIVLATVWVHYRRKKKIKQDETAEEDKLLEASPEQVGYTNGNGEYILFDHSGLIREYKKRLSYNHARITALQNDFSSLKGKYTALAHYTQSHFLTPKNKPMKNESREMQAEITRLLQEHHSEKQELHTRIDQLGKAYAELEEENRSVQAQLSMMNTSGEERNRLIRQWTEENSALRDKVAEHEYLHDLLEEKNAEIGFLRSQIEQRIRQQHEAEHRCQQALSGMEELKKENADIHKQAESVKNTLLLKQDEADKMQVVICGKEEEIAEKQLALKDRLDHLAYLENVLSETRQKNEMLNAELADARDRITVLEQHVDDERSRVHLLEDKLQSRKQLMKKLYKEFSASMEEENTPPVIVMRTDYGNGKENEEFVAQ